MRAAIFPLLLFILSTLAGSCGPSQASEQSIRKSQRFYDAAYIAWRDQGDNLSAIRHLTRAVDENPANDDAQYLLGTIRLGRGEYEEAEKHLLIALEHRGKDKPSARVETQNSLGVLYILTERSQEAVSILLEATGEVLNREPWLAYGNLGWAYTELGQFEKAEEAIKRALFDQPKFCVGLYRLGNVYYQTGDYIKAKANLSAAVAITDGGCDRLQEAYHLLGMTELRLDNVQNAVTAFERCVEISPNSEVGIDCATIKDGF